MSLADIELSHLRYFLVLAEELHFGRAAARLHMAQPPLTRQIKILETRLQCRLFERNSRSTRLTQAGEHLLQRVRAILADSDLAFQAIQSLGRGEEGHLTVATAPSLMLGGLPRVIRTFRQKYPRVDFRLSEMASSAILQSVQTGTADLGFVRGIDKDQEIETHLRWKEPLMAIVPHDFPVKSESRFTLTQMRHQPFVFFPRHLGPSFYDEVIHCCRRSGYVPNIAQEARQWSSIISLVSAGMGVSLGPASVSALLPQAARFLPLKGLETTTRLVGRPGAGVNPALTNFLQIARREYAPFAEKAE